MQPIHYAKPLSLISHLPVVSLVANSTLARLLVGPIRLSVCSGLAERDVVDGGHQD